MSSKPFVFAVPFRAFARRLRLVTSIRQPLQVVEAVVVAWNDVVAIGADSVASFRVSLRFASSVRASLDGGAARRPVVRQPQASVACVPVHPVAWHAACPLSIPPCHTDGTVPGHGHAVWPYLCHTPWMPWASTNARTSMRTFIRLRRGRCVGRQGCPSHTIRAGGVHLGWRRRQHARVSRRAVICENPGGSSHPGFLQ